MGTFIGMGHNRKRRKARKLSKKNTSKETSGAIRSDDLWSETRILGAGFGIGGGAERTAGARAFGHGDYEKNKDAISTTDFRNMWLHDRTRWGSSKTKTKKRDASRREKQMNQ